MAEEVRTAVRQVRRDLNDRLKKIEKEHEISQDDERRAHDDVQKMTDKFIEEVNQGLKHKEQEIMEV
jgi:ribosome recycling factor